MHSQDIDIPALRQSLHEMGSVVTTDRQGKRLFLVLSKQLDVTEHGVLLAYEGQGAYFFTLDRPLNKYRLVQGGFSLDVAPFLSDLINALMGMHEVVRHRKPAKALLEPPRGDGEDHE
jgi:hypothetical protein